MALAQYNTTPPTLRGLGKAVRAELVSMGHTFKVVCKSMNFSGFGYGQVGAVTVHCLNHKFTEEETKKLQGVLRKFVEQPGGPSFVGISGRSSFSIETVGSAYSFGNYIRWSEKDRVDGLQAVD